MPSVGVLLLAYVMSQFYRVFLAVLTPVLREDLAMTATQLSIASGAWFLLFGLAQFPIGKWLDTHGPRRTAGWLLLIGGGGGAALFGLANSPEMIFAAMALIGIGCAPVLMASFFIFAKEFSPERFALLGSVFVGLGTLGNILGSQPLAQAVQAFGWREVAFGLAGVTAMIALAVLAIVRDPAMPAAGRGKGSIFDLLRMPALWLIIPLVAINYSVPGGIRGLWAGPYLADVYGMDAIGIGRVTLAMAIGLSAGSILYGPLDRLVDSRKWVVFGGNAIVLAALLALVLTPSPGIGTVTAILAIIGLCGASYGVIMAHGKAFFPAHLTGRGVTLLNFFSIGGVGILQFAGGGLVAAASVPGDPASGYMALFWMYAILLGASLAVYVFSRDVPPSQEMTIRKN